MQQPVAAARDARQRLRVYCSADVEVVTGDRRMAKGQMRDVGLNSLYLLTDEANGTFLIEGEPVRARIAMQRDGSNLTIELDGRVSRMDDFGFVVQFSRSLRWWPVFIIFPNQKED
jgi:hypothetical protein